MADIHVSVMNIDTLKNVLGFLCAKQDAEIKRIYVDISVPADEIKTLYVPSCCELFLSSMYVFRDKDREYLNEALNSGLFKGVLIRNIETLFYLNENGPDNLKYVLDSGVYIFNSNAFSFLKENLKLSIDEIYFSNELNLKEKESLYKKIREKDDTIKLSTTVYGHLPMMISANCISRTLEKCTKSTHFTSMKDRMGATLSVFCCCEFCYNVIYNSVPLSLHKNIRHLSGNGALRLDLTSENNNECIDIIKFFDGINRGYELNPPYKEYTTGHSKKGVL